jgi:hypothetical protein
MEYPPCHGVDYHPIRVLIYACVTNNPRRLYRRNTTIGEAYCEPDYRREYHGQLNSMGRYDYSHIASDFDSMAPAA